MTPTTFRALREHLGLSVAYAAGSLGVTTRTLSRWEAGDTKLPESAQDWLQNWVDVTEAHMAWAADQAQNHGQLCLHAGPAQYRAAHRAGFLDHRWWNRCAARVAASTGAELAYEACRTEPEKRVALDPPCVAGVE